MVSALMFKTSNNGPFNPLGWNKLNELRYSFMAKSSCQASENTDALKVRCRQSRKRHPYSFNINMLRYLESFGDGRTRYQTFIYLSRTISVSDVSDTTIPIFPYLDVVIFS